MALQLVLCCVSVLVQMSHRSSHGKEPVIDGPSSPVSKRTRHSSHDSNNERFKTPFDSQTFSNIFEKAPTVVEQFVRFDTLGTTFIPRIFEEKDWVDLFGNFKDPIDELVKEFYFNARFTGVELNFLQCKIFFKFLGQIMTFLLKARLLELQILHLN